MFTESSVAENVEIKDVQSVTDLDFGIGKLSVSPVPHDGCYLRADESSMGMVTSDVSGADLLLPAFDSISFDVHPELTDDIMDMFRSDAFDSICENDPFGQRPDEGKEASKFDLADSISISEPSNQRNGEAETLGEIDKTHQLNQPLIVYTSSRRTAHNSKSNPDNEFPKTLRSCREMTNENSVVDLSSLQSSRRRRSVFSKRARSSVWGSVGNVLPDFEEHNGPNPNFGKERQPRGGRGVQRNRNSIRDQVSVKSIGKSCTPTGRISLKIRIGSQSCAVANVTGSLDPPGKSISEVLVSTNKVEKEVSGNRGSDAGTSPDSEVINSVPDVPAFEDILQIQNSPIIAKACVSSGDESGFSLPDMKSNSVKKKDKFHQPGHSSVDSKLSVAEVMCDIQLPALGLRQNLDAISCCTDASLITTAKQHCRNGSLFNATAKPDDPSHYSRVTCAGTPSATSEVLHIAEMNSSSVVVDATIESLKSQDCETLLPCISSQKIPKHSGAKGGSKSRSTSMDLPRKKDKATNKKGKKNNLGGKHQVKEADEANGALKGLESHLVSGHQTPTDPGETGALSKDISGEVSSLQFATYGEMDQFVPPRNAWVLCDVCQKWRRIPATLADQIEETKRGWTCKENMDKDFADCSIPQEKSNSEINEELEISDADDAGDTFLTSSQNRLKAGQKSLWSPIKSNLFLQRNRKKQTIDEVMVCHCKPPSDGRMGCGAKCLNRILNIECVKGTCPCGELCSNQQFQKRKYARLQYFKCGKKGYGLQALENISEGQFLIEYVGEVLDMQAYEARQKEYALDGHKHFYFMTLNGSEVIDACAKGNLGRFINHSCDPNCRTEKWMVNGEVCVGLFAIRDIKKSEEVTFDYNYVRVFGAAAKRCVCGSPNCRGYIGGDPKNSEIIVQGDSDDEYPEPFMICEDSELKSDQSDKILESSNHREKEITNEPLEKGYGVKKQVNAVGLLESIPEAHSLETFADGCRKTSIAVTMIGDKLEVDGSVGKHSAANVVGQLDFKQVTRESFNGSESAACMVQSDGLQSQMQSSSYSSAHESEVTTAISPSKSLSDAIECKMKLKYAAVGGKREPAKSNSPAKPHRPSSSIKKGKIKSNVLNGKGTPVVDKLNEAAEKSKKQPELSINSQFETVEEKLNDLLEPGGGISKRKDASRGYLKLLFLTAASGYNGHGESIQSNRDLSMILDALLKTKSRTVLVDIINKNGLQMLHNILNRCRKVFNKTPIMRKLLKVLEYLAMREILTLEHITGGPPRPGVESFKDSILTLTEHVDKQVHQIARNFRDRWIPRNLRKNYCVERDDGRMGFHARSGYGGLSVSHDKWGDRGKPSEVATAFETQAAAGSGTSETSTLDHSTSVSNCGTNETKPRKRKSRWDNAEEYQHSRLKTESNCDGKQEDDDDDDDDDDDIPPGFSTPFNGPIIQSNSSTPPGFSTPISNPIIPSNGSSTSINHQERNTGIKNPSDFVWGYTQQRFVSRMPLSYGVPSSVLPQFGVLKDEISAGVQFYPFPPLPPYACDKEAKCGELLMSESAEKAELGSDTCTTHSGQKHARTWSVDPADINVPVVNDRPDCQRGGFQNLGRKFRQQKFNHSKLAPPWVRMRQGWGYPGNNAKNVGLGNGMNESSRSSYNSEEMNWRGEF